MICEMEFGPNTVNFGGHSGDSICLCTDKANELIQVNNHQILFSLRYLPKSNS
jgi:hypothetical protein